MDVVVSPWSHMTLASPCCARLPICKPADDGISANRAKCNALFKENCAASCLLATCCEALIILISNSWLSCRLILMSDCRALFRFMAVARASRPVRIGRTLSKLHTVSQKEHQFAGRILSPFKAKSLTSGLKQLAVFTQLIHTFQRHCLSDLRKNGKIAECLIYCTVAQFRGFEDIDACE